MFSYLLGAPGSGKSTLVGHLRQRLPAWVVLDWDGLMEPAGELAGSPIRQTPQTWAPYGRLVRAMADQVLPADVLLLGVCTPEEMTDWPDGPWLLLDCSDAEREARLAERNNAEETAAALGDAAEYRTLGLPVIDTTGRTPSEVTEMIIDRLRAAEPS